MSTDGSYKWRISVLGVVVVVSLFVLARRLYSVQVTEQSDYSKSLQRQSVRRVLLPATRGRIFDRNGICLADTRPSYSISFFVEEMRRPGNWSNTINAVDAKINDLSLTLGIPREITRDDVAKHVRRQLPLPLLAWQDVDEKVLARFAELITPASGMDVYVQPERVYPLGKTAAHLLGYVGRDKPVSATNEVSHYNIMGMKGRAGVELYKNDVLSGTPGGKLITVDVSGYRHSETNRPPVNGEDVHLTIMAPLQSLCEKLLGDRKASVVAVDPRSGDILAMASEPAFDPGEMSPRVSGALWKRLNGDPKTPLLNRALSGIYPPGSTFKPLVALAALENGVSPSYSVDCNGVFSLGAMRLKCASRYGHGNGITMGTGLEQSCNPYFCSLGVHVGIDTILSFAEDFGFGRQSGIGLGGEARGLLPDDAWKRRVKKDSWRQGDTANLSIGQGFLLVTPLQLALYASVLANKGTLYKPRLYMDEPVVVRNKLAISERNWNVVRSAMLNIVGAPMGGGRRARVPGVKVAAKTGTAEYGPRSNRKKHTWMIAFAPYDEPTIAVAVLVEDGESGGLTAAPIVSAVFSEYFGVTEKAHIEDATLSEYAYPEETEEAALAPQTENDALSPIAPQERGSMQDDTPRDADSQNFMEGETAIPSATTQSDEVLPQPTDTQEEASHED